MNANINTKNIILLALFAAISIIFTRFLSFYLPIVTINTVRISLGNIPIVLAGLLLGPFAGAATGIVADVVGTTMFSPFPYFPGFTLSAALVGFIPGILRKFIKGLGKYTNILIIVLTTELITSIGLNTLWISTITNVNYFVLMAPRAGITLIMSLIYSWIIFVLLKRLKKEIL
ncbi:MAG: folate family ECF transporter S component [Bacillota bacterium]